VERGAGTLTVHVDGVSLAFPQAPGREFVTVKRGGREWKVAAE
jgi:hypothetical protein